MTPVGSGSDGPGKQALAGRWLRLLRSTPFRLSLIYGFVFILGIGALLGAVYGRTADFLIKRVDSITKSESERLAMVRPEDLPAALRTSIANDSLRLNTYALFTRDGVRIEGNGPDLPPDYPLDQSAHDLADAGGRSIRGVARALPTGEVLLVGRDTTQILDLRRVVLSSLIWSGVAIALIGLAAGVLLSRQPMARLTRLEAASLAIMRGDLATRMPLDGSGDELDLFASAVNRALEEVESLMLDIKGVADAAAHDLRTPLTRVRASLHRVGQEPDLPPAAALGLEKAVGELDDLLERFRALLRISELESRDRRAGFARVEVTDLITQALELYEPLAEGSGVTLKAEVEGPALIEADGRLMFEALANLVDNAIKFSGPGAEVLISLRPGPRGAELCVRDFGPGIEAKDRDRVLQRFRRGAHYTAIEGSGLGLSIVSAIVRLHRFELHLNEAAPGLEVKIVLGSREN